jgi:hypothetical protein
MEIKPEQLNELRARYPGGLYEGSISFTDEDATIHTVEFIYRKPTTGDIEAHTKTAQRNPLVANSNLMQSLIVYPESGTVITAIREYPAVSGNFVSEAISPFFGENVAVKTRKL